MHLALILATLGTIGTMHSYRSATSDLRDTTASSDLIGLWGSESVFGPDVRGELTLTKNAGGWTARVGGRVIEIPVTGDSMDVKLPDDRGEFRGKVELLLEHKIIRGFWIQPAGQGGVQYATPVVLHPDSPATWRGVLSPLDERWSLYLRIERADDGSLHASFRNPDANWRGGASVFRIARDGGTIRLLDIASGKQLNSVQYDSAGHRILMDFGRQIVLTRRDRNDAVGYYARTPASDAYEYAPPATRSEDGWSVARARDTGMDEAMLSSLVRHIVASDSAAVDHPLIHSVLIARHGKLVLEEYFHGFDATRVHDLRSASKTFASVMLGAAMRSGAHISPSAPAYSLFPNGAALAASDPRRARITIGHLLSHTSGLACDDGDDASPGGEERMQSQQAQPDWAQFTLALPMLHEPGSAYAYCSGGPNLVVSALAEATREWMPELFNRTIARPLDMEQYAINLTPTGEMYGGGGMYVTPRDFLKFGALYLNHGEWRGRRIISPDWITQSTSKQADAPSGADGYAWHLYTLHANGHDYREYEANGNGGQFLIVLPELDIAIVFTAGNYGQYRIWRKFRDELVPQYVIPAVKQ